MYCTCFNSCAQMYAYGCIWAIVCLAFCLLFSYYFQILAKMSFENGKVLQINVVASHPFNWPFWDFRVILHETGHPTRKVLLIILSFLSLLSFSYFIPLLNTSFYIYFLVAKSQLHMLITICATSLHSCDTCAANFEMLPVGLCSFFPSFTMKESVFL